MQMNPYAQFLEGRDALDIVRSTVDELEQSIARIKPERAQQPHRPGKWSVAEIVAHLADCEIAFGFRLRQSLGEPGHTVQPFDQTVWAERYTAYDLPSALITFSVVREWNLRLLTTVSEQERSNEVTHPERGTMTFWDLVETMAGHDRNHLLQIRLVAEER